MNKTEVLDSETKEVLVEGGPELERLCRRIDRWFFRSEVRQRLRRYLQGLLASIPRRNGWQMAEQIGERDPSGVQRLVREAQWDADYVRDDLREYVVEFLGHPEGILVVDETGFLKKGRHSAGVARQYSGTAGRVENCQIGVFLAYTSANGTALLDRELYLPREWTEDTERCEKAGIPEDVAFATKPELAKHMIERALEAGVPCRWVAGDEVYGNNPALRLALERRKQPYVLAVASHVTVWLNRGGGIEVVSAAESAETLPEEEWQRISGGDGAKGPRLYDWTWIPPPHSSARASEENTKGNTPADEEGVEPEWTHRLLLRRSVNDPTEFAYYFIFAPVSTRLEEVVRVAGSRWTIEGAFEGAKQEVGLDEYEVRSWTGWYRYVTLSLLAYACLAALRSRSREATIASSSEETSTQEEEKGGQASDFSTPLPGPSRRGPDPLDDPGDPPIARKTAGLCSSFLGGSSQVVGLAEEASSACQALSLPLPTTPSIAYLLL